MTCFICGKRQGTIIVNKVYGSKSCRKCQVRIMEENIALHKQSIEKLHNDIKFNLENGIYDNQVVYANVDYHVRALKEYSEKGIKANR